MVWIPSEAILVLGFLGGFDKKSGSPWLSLHRIAPIPCFSVADNYRIPEHNGRIED